MGHCRSYGAYILKGAITLVFEIALEKYNYPKVSSPFLLSAGYEWHLTMP